VNKDLGRTIDGIMVEDGLAVFDYDLRVGFVDTSHVSAGGWFDVIHADGTRSLMNSERLWVRHPSTNVSASRTWAEQVHDHNRDLISDSDCEHTGLFVNDKGLNFPRLCRACNTWLSNKDL
jgi:hypothetical protein